MKHYNIRIKRYPASMQMAERAFESGLQHSWDVEYFNGVDGSLFSAETMQQRWGITICRGSRKTQVMMETRPGVRGCFISHWLLWNQCRDTDTAMGIFEHDVIFQGPPRFQMPQHVMRLEGFDLKPPRPAGAWYEGARAYILTPVGADRLIEWVQANGCLPADVVMGQDVLDIELDPHDLIALQVSHGDKESSHTNSFTWNLPGMERV